MENESTTNLNYNRHMQIYCQQLEKMKEVMDDIVYARFLREIRNLVASHTCIEESRKNISNAM